MPRHKWLRDLLAEKRCTQSDLAKAWGEADGLFGIGVKLAALPTTGPEFEDYEEATLAVLADINRMLCTSFSPPAVADDSEE